MSTIFQRRELDLVAAKSERKKIPSRRRDGRKCFTAMQEMEVLMKPSHCCFWLQIKLKRSQVPRPWFVIVECFLAAKCILPTGRSAQETSFKYRPGASLSFHSWIKLFFFTLLKCERDRTINCPVLNVYFRTGHFPGRIRGAGEPRLWPPRCSYLSDLPLCQNNYLFLLCITLSSRLSQPKFTYWERCRPGLKIENNTVVWTRQRCYMRTAPTLI